MFSYVNLDRRVPNDHPLRAIRSAFSKLFKSQGRYPEAEPLYQRALAIFEKALGPEHPNVAQVSKNYADLLRAMGREAEAKKLEKASGKTGKP